jgi:hypothetical protein
LLRSKKNELLEYALRSDAVSAVNFLESIHGIDLEIENYEADKKRRERG